jgi:hypothetical protein
MTRYGRQTRARGVVCLAPAEWGPHVAWGPSESAQYAGDASDAVAWGAARACRRREDVGVTRHNLHSARRSIPYQAASVRSQSNQELSYT